MKNFTYHNPVKVYFGKGQIAQLRKAIPPNKTIMFNYDLNGVKHNGVYHQVIAALHGRKIIEFCAIQPNPQYCVLMDAVELARANKVDYIVAAGGGSVIDGTKFISAAINFRGEPWDILEKNAAVTNAIPFCCILTLPGTGAEVNCGSVISRDETQAKLEFIDELVLPQFSILDPTTTYTLPMKQTCNGIVDALTHVIEQYVTNYTAAPLLDRFAEGIMLTLIEEGEKVLQFPHDYHVRANIMWSSTWALNTLLLSGVPVDWAAHNIGHELTALFGLDHAQTLALLLPSVLRVRKQLKHKKLLQFAARIWNIDSGTEDERIEQGIVKLEQFFRKMSMSTRLTEVGISVKHIPAIIKKPRKKS